MRQCKSIYIARFTLLNKYSHSSVFQENARSRASHDGPPYKTDIPFKSQFTAITATKRVGIFEITHSPFSVTKFPLVMSTTTTPAAAIPAWLVWYLTQLSTNPLRTKAITGGILSGCQEATAQKLSGVSPSRKRIFQMAAYGKCDPMRWNFRLLLKK